MRQTFRQRLATSYDQSVDTASTEGFSTSWLISAKWFCILRGTISLYAFTVLFVTIGYERSHGLSYRIQRSFSYFTVLGYWGLAFYFAVAAAHSGSQHWRGRSFLSTWPVGLRWLHGVLYCTVTVFPFLVSAVFWAVLARGALDTRFSTWSNVSQHVLNSVLALFEIVVPKTDPLPWINLVPLVVVLGFYLGLVYLTHYTQGFYVYGFLNPKYGKGVVAGACIVILAAMVVIFSAVHHLIGLRKRVTQRRKRSALALTDQMDDGPELPDDMEMALLAEE